MVLIKSWDNGFVFLVISCLSPIVANIMILEVYVIINLKARRINRDTRKLTQISTLIKKYI